MKKFTLMAFAMLMTFSISAQKEEGEREDTTVINMGNKRIVIYSSEDVKVDIKDRDDAGDVDGHWAGIDMGVNVLMNEQFSTSFPDNKFLENDPAKSWNVNLNFAEHTFDFANKHVGITTGLGFSYSQFGLKDNYVLNNSADTLTAFMDTTRNYSKNKLRVSYLTVPLLLEFNTSKYNEKNVYLSVGVVGGVRIGSSTKRKAEFDGSKKKTKIKDTYGINAFKLDAIARLGYRDWGVYASLNMVPLFEKGQTENVYPLSFGLSLSF